MRRVLRATVVGVIAMLLSISVVQARAQQETAEHTAETSDLAWLALADAGQYGECWDASSAYFKAEVKRDQWVGALGRVRGPLGKVVARVLGASTPKASLPGGPHGKYMVTQYATAFENKKNVVETIISTKERDGVWRMAGYFIQ